MSKCAQVFGNMELDLGVPIINVGETNKKVLAALNKYRLCQKVLSEDDRNRVIAMVETGNYDTIASTDEFKQYAFIWKMEQAINNLNFIEQQIIREGYLSKEKHNWVKMAGLLNMSKSTYYEYRLQAFESLARKLKIEVYY
ncbi:ArpU family transcriptional regulator [Bacillus anthracis]|nr:ArpU family transcriptional regulator [Bacillus anthracis]